MINAITLYSFEDGSSEGFCLRMINYAVVSFFLSLFSQSSQTCFETSLPILSSDSCSRSSISSRLSSHLNIHPLRVSFEVFSSRIIRPKFHLLLDSYIYPCHPDFYHSTFTFIDDYSPIITFETFIVFLIS